MTKDWCVETRAATASYFHYWLNCHYFCNSLICWSIKCQIIKLIISALKTQHIKCNITLKTEKQLNFASQPSKQLTFFFLDELNPAIMTALVETVVYSVVPERGQWTIIHEIWRIVSVLKLQHIEKKELWSSSVLEMWT